MTGPRDGGVVRCTSVNKRLNGAELPLARAALPRPAQDNVTGPEFLRFHSGTDKGTQLNGIGLDDNSAPRRA